MHNDRRHVQIARDGRDRESSAPAGRRDPTTVERKGSWLTLKVSFHAAGSPPGDYEAASDDAPVGLPRGSMGNCVAERLASRTMHMREQRSRGASLVGDRKGDSGASGWSPPTCRGCGRSKLPWRTGEIRAALRPCLCVNVRIVAHAEMAAM